MCQFDAICGRTILVKFLQGDSGRFFDVIFCCCCCSLGKQQPHYFFVGFICFHFCTQTQTTNETLQLQTATAKFITIFNVNMKEKCGLHHELCATEHLFPIHTLQYNVIWCCCATGNESVFVFVFTFVCMQFHLHFMQFLRVAVNDPGKLYYWLNQTNK